MMKKYQFSLGLTISILAAAWLIYLANLPLPARSMQRGAIPFGTTLLLLGIAIILYDTFSRNRERERLEAIEKSMRHEISTLQEYTSISDIDLNTYIRNVTGKPGISSLNVDELVQIREFLQQIVLKRTSSER